MGYYLITFSNTHSAIAAQKYLEDKLSFHVCPTLREISDSCGISLRLDSSTYDEIQRHMLQFPLGTEMYKIYHITSSVITEMK
jgi:hypothetical protein